MPWVAQEIAMKRLGRLEILPLLFFKALWIGGGGNWQHCSNFKRWCMSLTWQRIKWDFLGWGMSLTCPWTCNASNESCNWKKECFGLVSKYEIINLEIKLKTQILEVATKHVEKLHVYNVNGSGSHLMFSTPKPIPHHLTYALTKLQSIRVTLCPICNHRFHCKDIIVASCGCTYHAWCLGFHMKMFHQCGQPTYRCKIWL